MAGIEVENMKCVVSLVGTFEALRKLCNLRKLDKLEDPESFEEIYRNIMSVSLMWGFTKAFFVPFLREKINDIGRATITINFIRRR